MLVEGLKSSTLPVILGYDECKELVSLCFVALINSGYDFLPKIQLLEAPFPAYLVATVYLEVINDTKGNINPFWTILA